MAASSQPSEDSEISSEKPKSPPPRTDGRVIPAKMPSFTLYDGAFVMVSMVTFLVDVGTDLNLVIRYILMGYLTGAAFTLTLVVIPAIIVMVFSLRWHIIDGHHITKWYWISHICLWGIMQRYILLIKTGIKARKSQNSKDFDDLYSQQSDVCMLRMFESFMESAPQLVLQLYIMLSFQDYTAWTAITAFSSMVSLGWGIAAYTKAMRNTRQDKHKMSFVGLTLQTIWRAGMIGARVAALALIATVLKGWLVIIMAIHMITMFGWVICQNTEFCSTKWEERLFNIIMAVIYCISFFNLKEGHSRLRMLLFYSITVTENIAFMLLYYYLGNHSMWIKITGLSIVFGGMTLGLLAMLMYYRFFHPIGPIKPSNIWFKKQNKVSSSNDMEKGHSGTPSVKGKMEGTSDEEKMSSHRHFKFQFPPSQKSSPTRSLDGVSLPSSPESCSTDVSDTHLSSLNNYRPRSALMCSVQDLLANLPPGVDACIAELGSECLVERETLPPEGIDNIGNDCVDISTVKEKSVISMEKSLTREFNKKLSSYDLISDVKEESMKRSDAGSSFNSQMEDFPKDRNTMESTHSSPDNIGVPCPRTLTSYYCSFSGPGSKTLRESNSVSILRTSFNHGNKRNNSSDLKVNSQVQISSGNLSKLTTYDGSVEMDSQVPCSHLEAPTMERVSIDQDTLLELSENVPGSGNYENIYNYNQIQENKPLELPRKPNIAGFPAVTSKNLDETSTTHSSIPHDYENICAVNINRAMLGVRHWKTYSDIEDRIHDFSTYRDRLQVDSTLTSSLHSDYSTLKGLSYFVTEDGESVKSRSLPDLSCLHLAPCIEEEEEEKEIYSVKEKHTKQKGEEPQNSHLLEVINQLRAKKQVNRKSSSVDDIPNYETIWVGEVEKPDVSEDSTGACSLVNQSSLVTTISDVRNKESLCNLYYSTMSDLSHRYYSERMLRQNSSVNSSISRASVKELSRASVRELSRAHVKELSRSSMRELSRASGREMSRAISVPDNNVLKEISEIIEQQKLHEQPNIQQSDECLVSNQIINRTPNRLLIFQRQANSTPAEGNKPRRKFSLLRERFEYPNWTPLRSPLNLNSAKRRNSIQDKTAKALQAGRKIFNRPRVHIITPKKNDSKDKDIPKSKSPFRNELTSPTGASSQMTAEEVLEARLKERREALAKAMYKSVPVPKTIEPIVTRTNIQTTPLRTDTKYVNDRYSALQKHLGINTGPATEKSETKESPTGPKTSTPEVSSRQLPQISILSAVSSVVPSPDALSKTNSTEGNVQIANIVNLKSTTDLKTTELNQNPSANIFEIIRYPLSENRRNQHKSSSVITCIQPEESTPLHSKQKPSVTLQFERQMNADFKEPQERSGSLKENIFKKPEILPATNLPRLSTKSDQENIENKDNCDLQSSTVTSSPVHLKEKSKYVHTSGGKFSPSSSFSHPSTLSPKSKIFVHRI
ncbi:uncharacterized protein LOC143040266 [Oratosquilla oratoria]|uniref:uncharacterized protein LOC143040266 n=1 Tax=Oratosquilla oratoria TaxID=337810 RepID=UPI003F75CD84